MFLPLLLLIVSECNSKQVERIYRGYPDVDNEYPFVVALERKVNNSNVRHCTGNLIKENWVVTAAHCLRKPNITITYGDRSTRTIAEVRTVLKVTHPQHFAIYNPQNWTIINDIGLIKVENIHVEKLATLTSTDYRHFIDLPVLYAGFGVTWLEKNLTSTEEQERKRTLYHSPLLIGEGLTIKCDKRSKWHPSICVGIGLHGSSARFGDSGGPLLYNGTVIGVSSGIRVKRPGDDQMIFVPVGLYIDWIHDVINENEANDERESVHDNLDYYYV